METYIGIFKKYSIILIILFLIIFSYLTVKPLLIPGFFPMHDDTQPTRMYEMTKALQDGMFPVRWSEDLGYGYGYPLFSFYAPLVYYLGGLIGLLGIDALLATKLVIGIGFLLSGIGMYFFAKEFWGELGGFLSGIFYLLVPYHAVNIYVRGDLTEFWASVLLPFVFWGFWGIYRYKQWRYVTLAAVSYAGVILSHNLTALMATPFLVVFIAFLTYKSRSHKKQLSYLILAFIFGLLLSAFYWLPVLPEMKYTNVNSQIGGKADYALHFVCPAQLWDSQWGFGGSAEGCIDGMSYRLGKLHMITSFAMLGAIPLLLKKQKRQYFIGLFATGGLLISLWLMTEWSEFFWQAVPFMSYFQYPWRFLLLATFFASFLAGGIVVIIQAIIKQSHTRLYAEIVTVVLLIVLSVFLYGKLFEPQTITPKTVADYTDESTMRWNISKISDEYLPQNFKKPASPSEAVRERLVIVQGNATINTLLEKTHVYKADISVQQPSVFRLQIAYFPGWRVALDGKEFRYAATSNGYVFPLRTGEHTISADFVQTPIEKVANLISLAGAAALFLAIIIMRAGFVARKHHGDKKTER